MINRIPDEWYEQLAAHLLAQPGAPQMPYRLKQAFPLLLRTGNTSSALGYDSPHLNKFAEYHLNGRLPTLSPELGK